MHKVWSAEGWAVFNLVYDNCNYQDRPKTNGSFPSRQLTVSGTTPLLSTMHISQKYVFPKKCFGHVQGRTCDLLFSCRKSQKSCKISTCQSCLVNCMQPYVMEQNQDFLQVSFNGRYYANLSPIFLCRSLPITGPIFTGVSFYAVTIDPRYFTLPVIDLISVSGCGGSEAWQNVVNQLVVLFLTRVSLCIELCRHVISKWLTCTIKRMTSETVKWTLFSNAAGTFVRFQKSALVIGR